MADNLILAIVGLMIAMIVGVAVVLPVVGNLATRATLAQTQTNETFTCTNATTHSLTYDNLLTAAVTLSNGTTLIGTGNYTIVASNGRITFTTLSNTIYGTTCYATYTYYPDEYLTGAPARTVAGLLPLLIVIALVVAVIAYYKFR